MLGTADGSSPIHILPRIERSRNFDGGYSLVFRKSSDSINIGYRADNQTKFLIRCRAIFSDFARARVLFACKVPNVARCDNSFKVLL